MKMKTFLNRFLSLFLVVSLLVEGFSQSNVFFAHAAGTAKVISADCTAYASSSENNGSGPEYAVDGNTGTRWASAWTNPTEWFYVDLGKSKEITGLEILWEGAYATEYIIYISDDESVWNEVKHVTGSDGGTDTLEFTATARFVKIECLKKSIAAYGYSFFEFKVFGTGTEEAAIDYGDNIALNKPTSSSAVLNEWWLYDEDVTSHNINDGDTATRWWGAASADSWVYIDLESVYTIGKVALVWQDCPGRIYDIQVSEDGINWTTVYREYNGEQGRAEIPLYTRGRYVKMQGYCMNTLNGYNISEMEVYQYVDGAPQPVYTWEELPAPVTVTEGSGSYLTSDLSMPQPKNPSYVSEDMAAPIASNDWWQSIMISRMGNGLCTLPLRVKYDKKGIGILTAGAGWLQDRSVVAEKNIDLYVMPEGMEAASLYNEVAGYGDYSVTVNFNDEAQTGMTSTIVKGSPYVYNEFGNITEAYIYSSAISDVYDDAGNSILATDGDTLTADHIGIEVTDADNQKGTLTSVNYYCITVPEETTFRRLGNKIKIVFPGTGAYLSVGSMAAKDQIDMFYQHGYAFVTDTKVTYDFDEATSDVVTRYETVTELKRAGFSDQTMINLLPHQWKKSDTTLLGDAYTYPSVRGTLKLHEGNTFTTVDKFYGIVPQFTTPENSEFDLQKMIAYLNALDQATSGNLMSADAYWQGKSAHPLAMGVLCADQLGLTKYKTKFLSRLKVIFEDWFTYSGKDDECFLYYDQTWGTMYYRVSEFGANTGITDHHFTYGYFVFSATVLATYDDDFYIRYKDILQHLVRDYANPTGDDMYCKFRSFDQYEGHSWAGGYADNDDGNNQEAAGESLFGWVGEYLWGLRTGNTEYRDAAIYGFTTELNAVLQYWFNYDGDNWIDEWTHTSVGQVYGGTNFFGTFFHGDPLYIYGIHWLPTSEYLTGYAFDQEKVAALYQGLLDDIAIEQAKADEKGEGYILDTPDTAWQHIMYPILSLSDADAAIAKFDNDSLSASEGFNAYWFANSMKNLGGRTKDIWATGGYSATVYKDDNGDYHALVWNPTDAPVTVSFTDGDTVVGTATVNPKALGKVNPLADTVVDIPEEKEEPEEDVTGVNLALRKITTSSEYEGAYAPANATDGSKDTRWASLWQGVDNPEDAWISVDLEKEYNVEKVVLNWENAYGKQYEILVSLDGTEWKTVYTETAGDGEIDDIVLEPVKARYIKMQGIERALPYGYSLYEFEVYGTAAAEEQPEDVAVTGISVSPENVILKKAGETIALSAVITPQNATNQNVTWSSSNREAAVVDEKGVVTAVASGTTTITVMTEDGNYTAKTAVTVRIAETEVVKTAALLIDVSGSTQPFGLNGELKPLTYIDRKAVIGEQITLLAGDDSTAEFAYWVNDGGVRMSKSREYTFILGGDTHLTAVYNRPIEGYTCIEFGNGSNQVLARDYYKVFTEEDYPDAPGYAQSEFVSWSMSVEEINAAIAAGKPNIQVEAVFKNKEIYYTVNVERGVLAETGKESGEYQIGMTATVKAAEAEVGYKFGYWVMTDSNGSERRCSYEPSYQFYVVGDMNLKAVYLTEGDTSLNTSDPITRVSSITRSPEEKKLYFTIERSVPSAYTVTAVGLVYTSDAETGASEEKFVDGTSGVTKRTMSAASNTNSGTISWTKTKVGDETWYVRGYIQYKDTEGNLHTYYGEIVSAGLYD